MSEERRAGQGAGAGIGRASALPPAGGRGLESGAGDSAEPVRPVPVPGAKRALDVGVSAALLVALTPVWTVVLAAVGLDMLRCRRDRGRVFYREPRISGGRLFELVKLRTLRESVLVAADGHARPLEADLANLTWAGRHVLKPFYLDELPQLVNVLRGDMSLVGPRPWPPELVERQVERGLDYRLRVRAGWTGPAQVAKGSDAEFEALDRDYVLLLESRPGLELVRYDVGILWRTLRTMLRREGLAY
jgi:lipopolysaccharide/colanic/teichoic acid biosynthesis glycosyltransferase